METSVQEKKAGMTSLSPDLTVQGLHPAPSQNLDPDVDVSLRTRHTGIDLDLDPGADPEIEEHLVMAGLSLTTPRHGIGKEEI